MKNNNVLFDEKLYDELKQEKKGDMKMKSKEMTLKQFQQTRKKVTGFYDYTDEEQGIPQVTAYTYWDTYDETIEGSNMVCECTHITIWDATTVAPTGQSYSELIKQFGGKYHLLLDRSEYNSNNLEELEKLLFEWTQEN